MKQKLLPEKHSDRETAWNWMLTNLLVLPGMGSVMAGRRVGYLQASLAIVGVVLTMVFAVELVREWWRVRQIPMVEGKLLLEGVLGVLCFGLGWLWALWTSLALLRQSKQKP